MESDQLSEEIEQDPTSACWWVYMIRADDHSLYTGVSTDVERRLAEHKAEASKHEHHALRRGQGLHRRPAFVSSGQ